MIDEIRGVYKVCAHCGDIFDIGDGSYCPPCIEWQARLDGVNAQLAEATAHVEALVAESEKVILCGTPGDNEVRIPPGIFNSLNVSMRSARFWLATQSETEADDE